MSLLELSGVALPIEGIILTGGCALNVLHNQFILDTLQNLSDLAGIGVFSPPAASDAGLTVGGLWKIQPPVVRRPLQYIGMRLWDLDVLHGEAQGRGARSLLKLGGVEYLAELLTGGPAWLKEKGSRTYSRPIVAVVRGRQEFGPRALGHRSLLASPDSSDIRDRLNKLKYRQWWRPVAPIIADEALDQVFGRIVKSPYMTMAPKVRARVTFSFPGMAHLDGTARHQSVGKDDEPWIHELLLAVGKRSGLAVLINTSFNTKGKPIVNTVAECLRMLDDLPELDYVLIEDWLFTST